ncbi:HAD hydrolase-like protein [Paenibacillus profundus]|uniref:HAD hydrolase-like protein n=1 Tax=Paenibacillus profundus TaxID=1173085 RepID=A0ABS8YK01_9BACL|nr:HAD hydrolase-like protein [Paenibacillus profundus]MCE5171274.1 HAD hydrolase-like protein [Paenibacillus profundus]
MTTSTAASRSGQSLPRPEAMIFDMDGTLFRTETLLIPAYHRLFDQLRSEGLFEGPTPPEELILSSLGMLLEAIWKRVMPDASDEARQRADDLLLEYELAGLTEGHSELYPQVRETLSELHKAGVKLFVASNGLEDYVQGVSDAHCLTELFTGIYSAGGRQTSTKVELVQLLLQEHNIASAWMVGDRSSDVEAGKGNELTVIGCQYAGFGREEELQGSDCFIYQFEELLELYRTSARK